MTHTVAASAADLKITYSDTLRVSRGCDRGRGYVALFMDSGPLPGGCQIAMYHRSDGLAGADNDNQMPVELSCVARHVAAGDHTFQVYFTTRESTGTPGCGTMQLGWQRGQNLLMIEELP